MKQYSRIEGTFIENIKEKIEYYRNRLAEEKSSAGKVDEIEFVLKGLQKCLNGEHLYTMRYAVDNTDNTWKNSSVCHFCGEEKPAA